MQRLSFAIETRNHPSMLNNIVANYALHYALLIYLSIYLSNIAQFVHTPSLTSNATCQQQSRRSGICTCKLNTLWSRQARPCILARYSLRLPALAHKISTRMVTPHQQSSNIPQLKNTVEIAKLPIKSLFVTYTLTKLPNPKNNPSKAPTCNCFDTVFPKLSTLYSIAPVANPVMTSIAL